MIPERTTPMLPVYDGRRVVVFILKRHWVGGYAVAWESFDADQRSLGIFASESEAAAAIPTAPEAP